MAKIKCPRLTCRSTNVEPVTTKKKMSFGKAAVGGLLLGPLGAAAGLYCKDCEHTFEVKP